MKATEKSSDATITVAKGKAPLKTKKIGKSLLVGVGMALVALGGVYGVARIQSCKVDQDRLEQENAVRDAQRAHIRVQYASDGHAVNCWVSDNDGVRVNGPTAEIYMSTWRDYKEFAKELGIDPDKCTVLNWNGKQ